MARKRPADGDYICVGCGCPCAADGSRHVGGGRGMRACGRPTPMLRSVFEAEVAAACRRD